MPRGLSFALIGAAGFVAPRHMKAIQDTGNTLVAALDPKDSVGIIDSYFPEADFFTEFERFDRHIDKLRRKNCKVEYVSICSPNYLHDAHIRFALRSQAHAICEKPLTLNPWNVDALQEIEEEGDYRVFVILQLRLHPSIIALKKSFANRSEIQDVDLTYVTARGHWYQTSWKGQIEKSGGIATNIGVHFFDMLSWVFGPIEKNTVHINQAECAAGFMQLKRARVRWFLSTNAEHLPEDRKSTGKRTFRSINVNGKEVEFSEGFADLHTESYSQILRGRGFGLAQGRTAIEIVHQIRDAKLSALKNEYHPVCRKVLST